MLELVRDQTYSNPTLANVPKWYYIYALQQTLDTVLMGKFLLESLVSNRSLAHTVAGVHSGAAGLILLSFLACVSKVACCFLSVSYAELPAENSPGM